MAKNGTETRERLVETALRLFRDEGYQATTMRRIATEAGVSLGNAYYYFEGKEDLVRELYLVVQRDLREKALPLLVDGAPIDDNLRVLIHAGLDVVTPFHGFGATLLQTALRPTSATSPFSESSSDAREMAIDLMRAVVSRSRHRSSAALRERLPVLLWMAYLGITLHWVLDTSPEQRRTRTLVDGVVPMVAKAVNLSRVPVARGLVDDVVRLMDKLVPTPAPALPTTLDAPGVDAATEATR